MSSRFEKIPDFLQHKKLPALRLIIGKNREEKLLEWNGGCGAGGRCPVQFVIVDEKRFSRDQDFDFCQIDGFSIKSHRWLHKNSSEYGMEIMRTKWEKKFSGLSERKNSIFLERIWRIEDLNFESRGKWFQVLKLKISVAFF